VQRARPFFRNEQGDPWLPPSFLSSAWTGVAWLFSVPARHWRGDRARPVAGGRTGAVRRQGGGNSPNGSPRKLAASACVADVTRREDMVRIFATARESVGPVRGIVDIVGMAKLGPIVLLHRRRLRLAIRRRAEARVPGPADRRPADRAERGPATITFVGSISGEACLPNEVVLWGFEGCAALPGSSGCAGARAAGRARQCDLTPASRERLA